MQAMLRSRYISISARVIEHVCPSRDRHSLSFHFLFFFLSLALIFYFLKWQPQDLYQNDLPVTAAKFIVNLALGFSVKKLTLFERDE